MFVRRGDAVVADQRDNVFVERIWKSVKYEEVYLHAYDSVGVARASQPIRDHRQRHFGLGRHTSGDEREIIDHALHGYRVV